MATSWRSHTGARALVAVVLACGVAACGGSEKTTDVDPQSRTVTVWILEHQPDRVRAMRADVATFTRRTGVRVDVVPIGDDELAPRIARARRAGTLPDVAQLPLDSLHAYARDGLLDTAAAEGLIDVLGDH